jgi:tetratricopeptide (TPR) repeat protein
MSFVLEPAAEVAPARQSRAWLEARCAELDEILAGESAPADETELRLERARLLTDLGRAMAARADHLRVLELAPEHRGNLFDLGRLLIATGQRRAAQIVYEKAVEHDPNDLACLVNLGSVLLQGDDPAGARMRYEAALRIDPDFPQAHGGMYYALTRLGEFAAAAEHRQKAFGGNHIFQSPYRGDGTGVPVLLLVSSTGGNTPIEKLLDEEVFQTFVVVADFLEPETRLPEHRLIVNGIGDADVSAEALLAADRFQAAAGPMVNAPAAVLATRRSANAARLAEVEGLVTAATATFAYEQLAGAGGAEALAERGFRFPLLLRAPGYHMGQHFIRLESAHELMAEVHKLPGAGRPGAELLAIEYLDARGADGCARKYRVMMVDGELYPLHLAISDRWKIHYFSADMADRPEHRAEERLFLENMGAVLGAKAMAALREVQTILALDYGGIDFGMNARGEVLLFEANATMVVEQPADDPKWEYRRAAVDRIHQAVRRMLLRRCGLSPEQVDCSCICP